MVQADPAGRDPWQAGQARLPGGAPATGGEVRVVVRAQDKLDLAGARAVLTAAGATVTERPERAQVAVLVVDTDPAAVLGEAPAGLPVVMVTPELTAEQAEPAARRHVVVALPKAAVTARGLGAVVAAAARSAARPTASQLYAQYLHTVAEAAARRRAQPAARLAGPASGRHRPPASARAALPAMPSRATSAGAPRGTTPAASPAIPPAPAGQWMAADGEPACELTERETTVLRHVANGLDTEEIAAELGCSRRTVIKCVGDVMHRYGLHNRPHVIAFAIRAGAL